MFLRKKRIEFPRNEEEAREMEAAPSLAGRLFRLFTVLALVGLLGALIMGGEKKKAQAEDIQGVRFINAADKSLEEKDVVVKNGGTLTIDGYHVLKSLTIENGGLVTHTPVGQIDSSSPAVFSDSGVNLKITGTLEIKDGGKINVDAAGFGGGDSTPSTHYSGYGPGPGTSAKGCVNPYAGDTSADFNGAGGSHGGLAVAQRDWCAEVPILGGSGTYSFYGGGANSSGPTYGDPNYPGKEEDTRLHFGSGGAYGRSVNARYPGGAGGGQIVIEATNFLMAGNASISANGAWVSESGQTTREAGGGAGGSIYIKATESFDMISVTTGNISARGGDTRADYNTSPDSWGGGGGGGRIAIYYPLTSSLPRQDKLSVQGGIGGGGQGTIVLKAILPPSATPASLSLSKSTEDSDPILANGQLNPNAKQKATFNSGEDVWVLIKVVNPGSEITGTTITDAIFRKEDGSPWDTPTNIYPTGASYANGVITWSNQIINNGENRFKYKLKAP